MNIYNYLKSNQISIFLSVLVFFPTIRLLLLGSGHVTGISLLVGLIPEILFAVILAWFLFATVKDQNRKTHLLDKLVLIYFLFNILIGFYNAHDLKASIYGFRLTYLPMLAYFVCSYYWDKKVDLERVFHGFFKVLVFVAVIGFLIYFFFPEVHVYFHKLSTDEPIVTSAINFVRMTSILWTPVVFAMLMLSAFCYWTYRYLKTGNNVALLFSLITVNAVFFSVSRGPMIASVIAFILLLLLVGKNRKFKLIILGILLLELTLFYLFVPKFSEILEWFFLSSKQTASLEKSNTRVGLWTEVIHSAKHNPMGLGLGKAGHTAVQLFPPGTPGVSFASTDGWYFKLMIETGIPALIMYLGLALTFFISMIRAIRRNTSDIVSAVFIIFVVTGLVNITSNALDFYLFSYLYWFLLGLFVFKLKQKENVNKEGFGSHS
ncbi:O-Antigen ligase [compost metagenome]